MFCVRLYFLRLITKYFPDTSIVLLVIAKVLLKYNIFGNIVYQDFNKLYNILKSE